MKLRISLLTVFALAALFGAATAAFVVADGGRGAASTHTASTGTTNVSLSTVETAPAGVDFAALYELVRPSIVEITTSAQATRFSPQVTGLGSGVVIDAEGDILTNDHVISGSSSVTVTFADGTTAEAQVVGRDAADDMAVVRVSVDAAALHPAKLGDSSQLKIGNVVFAIGNPFGLDGTLTTGVVSGLGRTLSAGASTTRLQGLIQTDTAVNPGNSGGALFNTRGEVIGINTAIENPSGDTFAGVAYAVPINTPKRVLSQLTNGTVVTQENSARQG